MTGAWRSRDVEKPGKGVAQTEPGTKQKRLFGQELSLTSTCYDFFIFCRFPCH
eukprot:m.88041 g.88041  ORF g.88041 m.88041 type:complete len:53 (+) comp36554_c0_seq2:568-726(+)